MRGFVAAAIMLAAWTNATAAEPPLSRAVQAGVDHGFKACAGAMDEYVKYLHENDDTYDHLGTWSKAHPDKYMFSTIISDPTSESDVVSSVSAVRNADGQCDVTFVQVVPFVDKPCAQLRETVFKDWKYYDVISKSTVLEESDFVGSYVILTPLKTGGCQVLKHFLGLGIKPD
jgi:hypothetical protein